MPPGMIPQNKTNKNSRAEEPGAAGPFPAVGRRGGATPERGGASQGGAGQDCFLGGASCSGAERGLPARSCAGA